MGQKPDSAHDLVTQNFINIKSLAVITWNVNFSYSFPRKRIITILNYIQNLITSHRSNEPPIIMLQEVTEDCFDVLLTRPFVQEIYDITEMSRENPNMHYGNVTLIPRAIAQNVRAVFRTRFGSSALGREAVYVDLLAPARDAYRTIRIANVHLESSRGRSDQARVLQLSSVASFLSVPGVHGGIVGGDMNSIGPLDGLLPVELGFMDAWLACESRMKAQEGPNARISLDEMVERDKAGHTWGYQPPTRHPPSRLDKILLKGGISAQAIERIGVSLKVDYKVEEERVWVSDHYGLLARVQLEAE